VESRSHRGFDATRIINNDMRFKTFLENIHSLSWGKITHPLTGEIIDLTAEENLYDSGFERSNYEPVIGKENKGKFDLLQKLNAESQMGEYNGEGKYPVWVKSTNEIFLIDKHLKTHPVTQNDIKLIQQFVEFQKLFQRKNENSPEDAETISKATIVTQNT